LSKKKVLLSVRELGGYPEFTHLYRQQGYEVIAAQGIRKSLAALKKQEVDVVIAEFNYAPTYGSRISTVETLLARLQTHHGSARIMLFALPEHLHHLAKLEAQYGKMDALTVPVSESALTEWLNG